MIEILDKEDSAASVLNGNWIGKEAYSRIWQELPACSPQRFRVP